MIKRIPNPFSANFSNATVVPTSEYSTIYIAGQVGHPPDGPVKVTAATLEKAGASMRDVVRITAYLTNLSDYPAYDRVRKETFPDSPPASSTVQVMGLLVNAHLEIDTVAVIITK
jgi:enamine deaminase RidA (YjgF/YER057c/UK114 family)